MNKQMNAFSFLESLRIDSLQSKFSVRTLFVAIVAIYSLSALLPIGDSDFSSYLRWYQELTASGGTEFATAQLPIITMGNLIYIGFQIFMFFLYVFLSFLYLALFLSERVGMPAGKGVVRYMKSLPRLVLFVAMITIPLFLPILSFPPSVFFILPHIFLAPANIIHEKRGPVDAAVQSIRKMHGRKMIIGAQILLLALTFVFIILLFSRFIDPFVQFFRMIEGFFVAFYVLSMGRMMGLVYLATFAADSETKPAAMP